MSSFIERYKNSITVRKIAWFIDSPFFPIALAAVILLFYYLSLDMVMIWFMAVCAIAMLATCRDVTPAFAIVLFMHIIISVKNSPSPLGDRSDYFVRPEIYIQVAVAISLCVAVLIARLVYTVYRKKFRFSPLFAGLVALSVSVLLNGAFTAEYTAMNLVYGIFIAAIYICIFMLFSGNLDVTKRTFERIAYYCCVFSVVLATELIVAYATYDGLFVNGGINRSKIFFGWGMYNTMGMLFCVCVPAWFYFAAKKKFGFIYAIGGLFSIVMTYMTLSRQSMVIMSVLAVVCAVWLLICSKGRERLFNIILLAVVALVMTLVVWINFDFIMKVIEPLIENVQDGGNRMELWDRAIEDFLKAPVFGVGFYYLKELDVGLVGLDIIPKMYHDTVLQMLAGCGIVGLVAYAVHRVQTIWSLIKNINFERVYIGITIGAFLLVSIFDNHMFYLFPTILYAALIGVLKASESYKSEAQTAKAAKPVITERN